MNRPDVVGITSMPKKKWSWPISFKEKNGPSLSIIEPTKWISLPVITKSSTYTNKKHITELDFYINKDESAFVFSKHYKEIHFFQCQQSPQKVKIFVAKSFSHGFLLVAHWLLKNCHSCLFATKLWNHHN